MIRTTMFALAILLLGTPVKNSQAQYPIFLGTGPYRLPWVEPMYTTPSFDSTKRAVQVPGAGTFYVRNQFEYDRLMTNLARRGLVQQPPQQQGQPVFVPGLPFAVPRGQFNPFFGACPMGRCFPKVPVRNGS